MHLEFDGIVKKVTTGVGILYASVHPKTDLFQFFWLY